MKNIVYLFFGAGLIVMLLFNPSNGHPYLGIAGAIVVLITAVLMRGFYEEEKKSKSNKI